MKTWKQKLQNSKPHQIKILHKSMTGMKEGQKMLIASPAIIDEYIRHIPDGTSVDTREMRIAIAKQLGAEVTCPLTTGIFLRIVAEAAYEAYENGEKIDTITPVWRVIDRKSSTLKKLSFDHEFLSNQRKREGLPS